MIINLDNIHLEYSKNLYRYNLKKRLFSLCEVITNRSIQEIYIDKEDSETSLFDVIVLDNQYYPISNLTQTEYFDEIFIFCQELKSCTITKTGLVIEKQGLEAALIMLLEK
jgi:hypothetical protein